MPNQPKTKNRGVRVADEIWDPAMERAREKGETVTDVVVRALKRYGQQPRT